LPDREMEIGLHFKMRNYKDPRGADSLLIVIRIDEDGEYLKVFAPNAFKLDKKNRDPFLKLCMILQWKLKLVQFEFDHTDGEIRPIVEFPVEDGTVTEKQLQRCIKGLCEIIDRHYNILAKARDEGIIDFSEQDSEGPTPHDLGELIKAMEALGIKLPEGDKPPTESKPPDAI
ncbi:MAG: hypothetical protein WCK47_15170, partial [bacterium]